MSISTYFVFCCKRCVIACPCPSHIFSPPSPPFPQALLFLSFLFFFFDLRCGTQGMGSSYLHCTHFCDSCCLKPTLGNCLHGKLPYEWGKPFFLFFFFPSFFLFLHEHDRAAFLAPSNYFFFFLFLPLSCSIEDCVSPLIAHTGSIHYAKINQGSPRRRAEVSPARGVCVSHAWCGGFS